MLLIFMGESCTGKSTIANEIKKEYNFELYSGKDYLRFAKNEVESWQKFEEILDQANLDNGQKNIIYVISEIEYLTKISGFDAKRIKFTSDLEVKKQRFAKRMNGKLPDPVAAMIKRKEKEWENVVADICIDTSKEEKQESVKKLIEYIGI